MGGLNFKPAKYALHGLQKRDEIIGQEVCEHHDIIPLMGRQQLSGDISKLLQIAL